MTRVTLEGTLRREAGAGPYVTLPFDVPDGTSRIEVRYRHDDGSILDLGLLDPRIGPFPSAEGFRGWSGSARERVFVALDGATPGYLAGPLPAGTWQVVLGLAHLADAGCRYRVEVDLASGREAADGRVREGGEEPAGRGDPCSGRSDERTEDGDDVTPAGHVAPAQDRDGRRAEGSGARAAPPAVPGPRWFRGDLHSHTYYSDARGSLEALLAAARARGLEFLAVTDHNTSGHHRPVREASSAELVLLPGEEVTTYRGHANVWGVEGWVDFRIRGDADVTALVEHVHARGGLFAVNHPRRAPGCIGCDWEYPAPDAIDCFEAWNGPWGYRNWEALDRYDALLRRGLRPTLVGGSDRHQPGWPDTDPEILWVGTPTTWLRLGELSEASLLEGLRSGRAFVSEAPQGPRLVLEAAGAAIGSVVRPATGRPVPVRARVSGAAGSRLRYVAASGSVRDVPVTGDSFEDAWSWQAAGPFLRAEVLAVGDDAAITAAFRELATRGKVPPWITLEEVLARPRRRALSNPVYFE